MSLRAMSKSLQRRDIVISARIPVWLGGRVTAVCERLEIDRSKFVWMAILFALSRIDEFEEFVRFNLNREP